MNTKDYQPQTRRSLHSATRWVCLFAAMLILCDLAASEALGQNCIEAYKNCSACGADTFQGRKLIGISTDSNGNCVATDIYGRKATDPGASEQLKACQKCLGGPVKEPTPTEVSVFILVTWMCGGDVREEQLFPMGGATVLIENETYPIQDDGTAVGIEPSGERRVTAFVRAATGGQKDERYRLAYVIKGPPDAGTKYYPDAATGYARIPLTGKQREPNYLTFRLVRDCPSNVPLSKEQLEIARYVVLRTKDPTAWQKITHLGNRQDAEAGMEVVNGDIIETGEAGAILLSIPDKLNRFQYYLMVGPETKVRLFFVPAVGDDIEPKFVVEYGTISQKLIRGEEIRIKKNTVSDRTTVGLEDGTIYSWGYNPQRQETTVSVEEGAVSLTPKNPNLQRITLRAGQQIQVTPNSVSAIRPSPGVSNIDYGNGISLGKVGNTDRVAGGPPH